MSDAPTPRKGRFRVAIAISVTVHVVGLICLLVWYARRDTSKDVAGAAESETTTAQLASPTTQASQAEGDPQDVSEPSPDVSPDLLEMRIERTREQYDQLSDEEKVAALDEQLKTLEAISSPESIEELTTTFEQAVGGNRAQQPAEEPVDGDFDFDSAQLHDVTREQGDDGRWHYRSVLLDAQGRTMEAELDETGGKTAYETMQAVKNSPFANAIYRRLVMPMIDNMMAAQRAAEQAALEAEKKEREPAEATETKDDTSDE